MTADDYHQQFRALLPPGPAWDAEMNPDLDLRLRALAIELARIDERAAQLLDEMDGLSFHELLPDWERVMDLPDPCLGPSPSVDDRKIAVRKRMRGIGGQRPAFFVSIAVEQGYPDARVVEHRAPRFGRSRFGVGHFGTWDAQFMWTLQTGGRQRSGRRWGISYWGERFGANPATSLVCLISRAAPAHTVEHVDFDEVS